MKDFFKYTLASIVGIFVSFLLVFFLILGIAGAIVSKSDKPVTVKDNSMLIVKFDNEITDRASNNPMENFDFTSFKSKPKIGLNSILKAIENAAEDPKIKGIYIENEGIPAGFATLEEIRNALIKFKESGKFVVSYSNTLSQKSYYLASIADKVMLNPEGGFEWVGLRSEIMFYKTALEKLGIDMQIIRHGKFKSAVEPFMYDKMSPENREQILTYMGSIWDHWVDGISEARNIDVKTLNRYADNLTIRNVKAALENNLIDSLLYKDQVIDMLKELTETGPEKDINSIGIAKYSKIPTTRKAKGLIKDKIAVIYASGSITMGNNTEGDIGGEGFAKVIRKARRDSTIKAIVLRVNSPGGSALASDLIWREMTLAKEVKPVIVSMGDVAASGGYYIAAPADYILANPTTITGSIGVFGMIPNVKNALNKKLGIHVDVVKTNKSADMMTVFRALTAEEKALIQLGVEDVYATFTGHVAEGRGMAVEEVDAIGQGRVWSGINAIDINLIDEFGGLNRAIEVAAEKANLEEYRIAELPKLKDPFEALMKELSGSAKLRLLQSEFDMPYKSYKKIKSVIDNKGIQARLPYDIEMY
ncbi:MAG: signal peptide peptidase SppA [Bacteroidales bacterium]|nr:signal peptide peptidase SppA [Bacteroidales bacterium]MDY0347637.1 signal peptide peptidase SppA [Tenuifilaceae bacterium]